MKLTFFDVLQRAMDDGPICKSKAWDTKVIPTKVIEKLEQHNLSGTFTPETLIPSDDDLADKFWGAGFDLALDTGMLCTSTERVVNFSEDELKEALRKVPSEVIIGDGQDTRVIKRREIPDRRPPICILGPFGTEVSEDLFIPILQSSAQYGVLDGVVPGFPKTFYGRKIRTGTPSEIIGIRSRGLQSREALRRAGRPGMPVITGGPSHYGCIGAVLDASPRLYIGAQACYSEFKFDLDTLAKVTIHTERNDIRHAFHASMIGGYAGGPEGTAIARIAANILITYILQGTIFNAAVYDIRYLGNAGREALWSNSISSQAMARNSNLLFANTNNPVSGPCTEMILHEVAANSINSAVDGSSWMIGIRSGGGKYTDFTTGLESKFAGEVCKAASGMKRNDANEIVKEIVSKYEERLRMPPKGKSFPECFDLKKLKPTEEWMEIYRGCWKDLENFGFCKP
jgi:methylamine--corrinoid protein Co-methyltransferase